MDDSEDDTLLTPAFAVDPELLQKGIITSPRDGLQFLANVVLERRKCKEVVSAPVPNSTNKQNVFVDEPPKLTSAPEKLIPTLEWQNCQVADFSDLRARVSKMNDHKDARTHPAKYPPVTENRQNRELWKSFLEQNEPALTLVITMKQSILEYLLEFLVEHLHNVDCNEGIQPIYGKWIFAVLASLELPLSPDACSSLRNIARNCSRIRSNLSPDDKEILQKTAPLNLFICLAARYFRQGDLAD